MDDPTYQLTEILRDTLAVATSTIADIGRERGWNPDQFPTPVSFRAILSPSGPIDVLASVPRDFLGGPEATDGQPTEHAVAWMWARIAAIAREGLGRPADEHATYVYELHAQSERLEALHRTLHERTELASLRDKAALDRLKHSLNAQRDRPGARTPWRPLIAAAVERAENQPIGGVLWSTWKELLDFLPVKCEIRVRDGIEEIIPLDHHDPDVDLLPISVARFRSLTSEVRRESPAERKTPTKDLTD